MAAAKEKLPPPEGTRAMMISMREMDSMGLKTGSGLRETVESKTFSKAEILEQIAQVGFMCPFHEFRTDIAKMQGDDLLIVADPFEVYGENWLVCLMRRAYDAQMEVLTQRERERQELLAAQEKEAAGDGEDDLSTIVYEDRPMLARQWVSTSAKESHDEVDALNITSSRPLIKLSMTKMSDEFNADYKFSDRDADQFALTQLCKSVFPRNNQPGFVEWRQHKDPNYELTRLEQDVGLQGILELVDGSTQTSWFRSVNSALQYEPVVMDAKKRQQEMDTEKMHEFLQRMLPLVEQALQQNETLDIFLDPFSVLNEEDPTLSNKNENAIKELRSFTDLVYSKNKTLPAIDWHPKKNGVVAVAAAANVNFSRRLDLLDKVDSSFILIWNFVDLIHPQVMLEAPQDVLTLRFNPSQPHIIAGGLYNGQVLVWDFSKAEHLISKGKSKNSSSSKASPNQDESQKQIPPVKPIYISYIDASHRHPVGDLMWLPVGMEVNNRGHLVPATDPNVNQFVTIAGDGQVSFWDLRFKDPKYRGITRTKVDKNAAKDAPPEVHFIPIYSISLTKVENSGELGLKCFCFEKQKEDSGGNTGAGGSGQILSSRFYCGTEEGEFVYADWRPHAAAASKSGGDARSSANKDAEDGGGGGGSGSGAGNGDDGVEYVQWLCRDHFRPIIGLCASPFFPPIFLTASEPNFHLWNVSQHRTSESNGPIFMSPLSLSTITCVAFSPTRPGVIYVGKSDGMLEVWDFMDQSHRSSLSVGIAACALTSIEFRPHLITSNNNSAAAGTNTAPGAQGATGGVARKGGALGKSVGAAGTGGAGATNSTSLNVKQQLVAIGDQIGNLHIMEIPRTLSRATSGERQAMEAYLKRESERMKAIRSSGDVAANQQLSTHIMQGNNSSSSSNARDDNTSSGSNAMTGGAGAGVGAMAAGKAASGDAATGPNPVDDEIFKRMEAEFCRELGVDTSTA